MAGLDTIFDNVIEDVPIKPPIAFLKELAQELTKKTKGLLIGEVVQNVYSNGIFSFGFYIEAPSLNSYRYHVFTIRHNLNFYPLSISKDPYSRDEFFGEVTPEITDEEEFKKALEQIFTSPEVKRVINGLLAQIKAA